MRYLTLAEALTIAQNHPLPDGNKRLAWLSLRMFCVLNGRELQVPVDEAVRAMLAIASGDSDESAVAADIVGAGGSRGVTNQPARTERGRGWAIAPSRLRI